MRESTHFPYRRAKGLVSWLMSGICIGSTNQLGLLGFRLKQENFVFTGRTSFVVLFQSKCCL